MNRALVVVVLGACGGSKAAAPAAPAPAPIKNEKPVVAAVTRPPLPVGVRQTCANVIDAARFARALGELEPIDVKDTTKNDPDAAAGCSLVRGGRKLTQAELNQRLKQLGKLGVLPGDEICNVSAYCWTIEEPERFDKRCAEMKDHTDDSLGFRTCKKVIPMGADDVDMFRFFDEDSRCVIAVRGGPANTDNASIATCAKAAHDLIGPSQVEVKP